MAGWRISLWVAVLLLVIGFLYLVRSILLPFLVVFLIATMLYPLVRKLRYRGFSRGMAVVTVLAPFYIVMFGAAAFIAPRIVSEVSGISSSLQNFTNSLTSSGQNENFFVRWNPVVQEQDNQGIGGSIDRILVQFRSPLQKLGLPYTREEIVKQYIEPYRSQINQGVHSGFESFFGILGSVAHQLFSLVVIFIGVPLLLLDMEGYKRSFPKWIPPSIRQNTVNLTADIGEVFTKYLRGISTVVIIYIVVASIVLSLFSVPYSILLAIVFGVFYLVPVLGNLFNYVTLFLVIGLSGTTGTFFLGFASPWTYAIMVVAIYVVIGLVFDQLIYPQLVGNAVGLSGVVNLFVILSGAALFGLVGMIVAFPIAGAMKIILDRIVKFTTKSQDSLSLPAVPLRHRRGMAS